MINDVGLLPIGGTEGAAMFFHVVNTRYEKGHPTLVTTNRGLPAWGPIFGDAVVAAPRGHQRPHHPRPTPTNPHRNLPPNSPITSIHRASNPDINRGSR